MPAPPPSSLYTTTFLLALLITLIIAASVRLLNILPYGPFKPRPLRRRPIAIRVLVVLGSGGHTHEMFYLLRDLDPRKYTHRTYIVSSGDAFSAGRAVEFERELKARELEREQKAAGWDHHSSADTATQTSGQPDQKPACIGPSHYNIVTLPRARRIHQSLLTTPFTAVYTLLRTFAPLLSSPPLLAGQPPQDPYEAAAADLPDLIITNGPATGVIVVLASLLLRFFNAKGAQSRGKCRTIYVESFARVTRLSLSGKILIWCVDRFLVQWEQLTRVGRGRAEFLGVLV